MLKELTRYYQRKGISALDFQCRHLKDCRKGNRKFVQAKAAFVGTEYEKGTLPRLLFVSLDPGESHREPEKRTVEFVRYFEEHVVDDSKLVKPHHWYRTHDLAWILLRRLKRDLRVEGSHMYFAHMNTVKCCMSNDDHKSGPEALFRNCRDYVLGEIVILKPDILVTQGNGAKTAVKWVFGATELPGDRVLCSHVRLQIGKKRVLWFHMNHPRDFGRFNRQRRECFEKWTEIVTVEFRSWRNGRKGGT